MGNHRITGIRNITMTLFRVEVRVEVCFTKQKDREKANRRRRNVEGVVKSQNTPGGFKFN